MPSPDESNVDNLVINTRPFVFKKLNPSNSDENTQPTQVKKQNCRQYGTTKYGNLLRVRREVNLKLDSATWILGQCYHNKSSDGSVLQDVSKQLKLDLLSKIWLTYRINFPIIPGTEFMSDSGWGCMLRCGQMMMAQALVCHFLQRDWRVSFDQAPEKKQLHKMILRWFGDSLSNHSPFSLHHLVSLGENYGRKAGDWYGPTHAAQVLRDALIQAKRDHPLLRNICMYVALNGIVFKQDVMDLCLESSVQNSFNSVLKDEQQTPTTDSLYFLKPLIIEQKHSVQPISSLNIDPCRGYDQESIHYDDAEFSFSDPCPSYSEFQPPSFNTVEPVWRSLILFVSVRLGNDKINPFYIPCLKSLLAYEHCIGIIGGRPKHALYFIGWQDDKLIHMDPHSCQPAIDVEKDDFNEKSFHSSAIRTMTFSDMDPSCAIGFYFRKKEEFDHFVEKFPEYTIIDYLLLLDHCSMKKNLDYPVFALVEGKQVDIEKADTPYGYVRSSLSHTNSKTDEDDYILL
ncbi:cysteine protease ATG4D [Caerostris extrusa]|uniref:Cysteine protease n=1 Tax=Caerostris extrusa TaxID=172846 RepID=A0AAV4XYB2_CAEEX|nr:cysteine protease ATG4D [Caerostris extrusa]